MSKDVLPMAGGDGDVAVLPQPVWEGVVQIAGVSIRCYVLDDGRRIFDGEDIERFLMPLLPSEGNGGEKG